MLDVQRVGFSVHLVVLKDPPEQQQLERWVDRAIARLPRRQYAPYDETLELRRGEGHAGLALVRKDVEQGSNDDWPALPYDGPAPPPIAADVDPFLVALASLICEGGTSAAVFEDDSLKDRGALLAFGEQPAALRWSDETVGSRDLDALDKLLAETLGAKVTASALQWSNAPATWSRRLVIAGHRVATRADEPKALELAKNPKRKISPAMLAVAGLMALVAALMLRFLAS
jgi:hypothetical protein